jgi:hypothetical protein
VFQQHQNAQPFQLCRQKNKFTGRKTALQKTRQVLNAAAKEQKKQTARLFSAFFKVAAQKALLNCRCQQ